MAIAAGQELLVVHGRNRKLSLGVAAQASVAGPRVTRQRLPYSLRGLAAGRFTSRRQQLAVLGGDGKVHLLERASRTPAPPAPLVFPLFGGGAAAPRDVPPSEIEPADTPPATQTGAEWTTTDEMPLPGTVSALVAGHVSASGIHDLIAIDAGANRLHIVSGPPRKQAGGLGITASLDAAGGSPAAVLPMRLNQHPLTGLVMLQAGRTEPVVAQAAPSNVFTVTNTNDSGAGSLRQAITDANNAQGGTDIVFNIPLTDPNRDPVTGAFTITPSTLRCTL